MRGLLLGLLTTSEAWLHVPGFTCRAPTHRPHASRGWLLLSAGAEDEVQQKRRRALRLEAEAKELELQARTLREARVPSGTAPPAGTAGDGAPKERAIAEATSQASAAEEGARREAAEEGEEGAMALRSPLRWIGPYPAIALSLPQCSSPAQKARQLTGGGDTSGVTLDFVLDTAANTNTINAQVASPTSQGGLELTQVGSVAGGVGVGGALGGGATFMLGNAELADAPKEERVVFMSGLTATALPIASPAAAGLLGTSFLNSFPGGVEFCWGAPATATPPAGAGSAGPAVEAFLDLPSVSFYGDSRGTEALRKELTAVEVTALPDSGLPSVMLDINGVTVRALLDTGSPITVLNAAAATAVGVGSAPQPAAASFNPFAAITAGLQSAQAASRGDVLTIGGANGPVQLKRVAESLCIAAGEVDLGEFRPYVGELPGLVALEGLGAGPAAVLGTDVLRARPRLWYTAQRIFL